MKKQLLLIGLMLLAVLGFAQVPQMRTNLRYNSSLCRYEVYVKPSANYSNFNMGGSQIVIAVPHNTIVNYTTYRRNAFLISTMAPSGDSWSITAYADQDLIMSYSGTFDYYAVDHSGGPLGALTANTEVLLFYFKLGNNCIDGIRLWEGVGVANGGVGAIPNAFNDPKYPTGGGDFETNFSEALTLTEAWVGNYNNTATVLPKPTLSISYVCDAPIVGYATITANLVGGASCTPLSYTWGGAGQWLVVPGTTNQGIGKPTYGTYTVSTTDNNGCSANTSLTLSPNCSQPLPVELINFTVKKDGNAALVEWATATEINNNYFDVEHSTDGDHFTKLERVYSKNGNSTSVQNYSIVHNSPIKGINYYRLKQVDFDGAFEYTDVRSIVFGNANGLTIYPNPANSILNVKVPNGMDNNSVIEIVNATGQVVRSIDNATVTNTVLELNVSDLALGYYFIQIRTSADLFREQFIITR
jgi:hypothetical protein